MKVAGYPATAFVAADGTIVQLQLGELSRAALADGIDPARKHRPERSVLTGTSALIVGPQGVAGAGDLPMFRRLVAGARHKPAAR